eukprot:TRINITY_DN1537_c0_g1_i5.p1 TRINITY_DN1537_c0_g1~~TRINITY_DN1537_c0_g1_i5.p1  ORF type:complete len:552 (+),score=121.33 TRINITY_DN1537_c0_g1_i5:276-1931(+)
MNTHNSAPPPIPKRENPPPDIPSRSSVSPQRSGEESRAPPVVPSRPAPGLPARSSQHEGMASGGTSRTGNGPPVIPARFGPGTGAPSPPVVPSRQPEIPSRSGQVMDGSSPPVVPSRQPGLPERPPLAPVIPKRSESPPLLPNRENSRTGVPDVPSRSVVAPSIPTHSDSPPSPPTREKLPSSVPVPKRPQDKETPPVLPQKTAPSLPIRHHPEVKSTEIKAPKLPKRELTASETLLPEGSPPLPNRETSPLLKEHPALPKRNATDPEVSTSKIAELRKQLEVQGDNSPAKPRRPSTSAPPLPEETQRRDAVPPLPNRTPERPSISIPDHKENPEGTKTKPRRPSYSAPPLPEEFTIVAPTVELVSTTYGQSPTAENKMALRIPSRDKSPNTSRSRSPSPRNKSPMRSPRSNQAFLANNLGFDEHSHSYQIELLEPEERQEVMSGSKTFLTYKILVRNEGKEWTIYRRYNSFLQLDSKLRKKGLISKDDTSFPIRHKPKKMLKEQFLSERYAQLNEYLHNTILGNPDIVQSEYLFNFLGPFQIGDIKPPKE